MTPILERLRSAEQEAVNQGLVDPAIFQPKVIRGWADLNDRIEHLYYVLGGKDRVLTDTASKIALVTFLEEDEAAEEPWERDVNKFLNDDSFLGFNTTGATTAKKHEAKDRKRAKPRVADTLEPSFMMLTSVRPGHETQAINATNQTTSDTRQNLPYSKIEDARNVLRTQRLNDRLRNASPESSKLEETLERAGLRTGNSLVDMEAKQDEANVDSISNEILSNQGVMQPEVAADPASDEVLQALLSAANDVIDDDSA